MTQSSPDTESLRSLSWFLQRKLRPAELRKAGKLLSAAPSLSEELLSTLVPSLARARELAAEYAAVRANTALHPCPPVVTRSELAGLLGRALPEGAPLALRYQGALDILARPKVGIVGSRTPSFYGRKQAYQFARELARAGCTIVSGGAIGVDAVANAVAHEYGTSCAVIGSGVMRPYPASNVPLFKALGHSGKGLVLSEFDDFEPPARFNFPRRNMVIALLSDFLLIVEAGQSSGSLITAHAALEMGIDVGALPGAIDSALSEGANELLKDGAFCIQSPRDVLERLASIALVRRAWQRHGEKTMGS